MPSIRRTLTIFAMPVSPARILEDLSPFYRQEEFPVLLHQCETWAESRPLEGCRVIDASPRIPEYLRQIRRPAGGGSGVDGSSLSGDAPRSGNGRAAGQVWNTRGGGGTGGRTL